MTDKKEPKLRSVRLNKTHREHMKRIARDEIYKANPVTELQRNSTISSLVHQLAKDCDTERVLSNARLHFQNLYDNLNKRVEVEETDDEGNVSSHLVYKEEMEDRAREALKHKYTRFLDSYMRDSEEAYIIIARETELRVPREDWKPQTFYRDDGTVDVLRTTTEEDRPSDKVWDSINIRVNSFKVIQSDFKVNSQRYGHHPAYKKLIDYIDRVKLHNRKANKRRDEGMKAINSVFDACASTKQLLEVLPSAERYMPDSLREQMRAVPQVRNTERSPSPALDAAKVLQQNAARARLITSQGQEQISKENSNDAESSGSSW